MPIDVVCPGCRKRFKVSDQFAGKKGPCPSCKAVIQVPSKAEEVVVHAPEATGPKNAAGQAVLKPIGREETKLSLIAAIGIGAGVLVVLALALVFRMSFSEGNVPEPILALGAILLAPPLVLGGYTFLRNDELAPHRGTPLAIRTAICAAIYAGLWGVYYFAVKQYLFEGDSQALELFHLVFIVPPFVLAGALASFASLDLDFGNAALHYSLYLLVTVLLRVMMGLGPF